MKIIALINSLLVLACACVPGAYAADESGEFLTVKKDVFLIEEDTRMNAKPSMSFYLQNAVETGEHSRTKLFFSDDSILNLGEESRVEIKEYLYNPQKERSRSVFRLVDGSLKVVVGRSDLEIHTPTAVAAARGTVFIMRVLIVNGIITTEVVVLEGAVLVRNIDADTDGEITLTRGQKSRVGLHMPPGLASPAGPNDMLVINSIPVLGIVGSGLGNISFEPGSESIEPGGWSEEALGQGFSSSPELPPIAQEPGMSLTPLTLDVIFPEG